MEGRKWPIFWIVYRIYMVCYNFSDFLWYIVQLWQEEKEQKSLCASRGKKRKSKNIDAHPPESNPDQQIRSPTSQTLKQSMKSDITVTGKKWSSVYKLKVGFSYFYFVSILYLPSSHIFHSVCILHPVCKLSLHFTLNVFILHPLCSLQSAVCSLCFAPTGFIFLYIYAPRVYS